MSYNARGGHGYGGSNRRRGQPPKKVIVKRDKEFAGIHFKDKTEYIFPELPSELALEGEKSGSLGLTNGVLGANGSITKKNKETIKFEGTDSKQEQ